MDHLSNPNLSLLISIVISLLVSIVSGSLAAFITIKMQRDHQLEMRLIEQKQNLLMDLLQLFMQVVNKKKSAGDVEPQMIDFKLKLMAYTKQETIKTFNQWMQVVVIYPENSEKQILAFEKLCLSLREEMGLKHNKLDKLDLIQTVVKDDLKKAFKKKS